MRKISFLLALTTSRSYAFLQASNKLPWSFSGASQASYSLRKPTLPYRCISFRHAFFASRSSMSSTANPEVIPGRPTWQQTMLRIKDPKQSIAFYEKLGFTLIDSFDFPQYDFSLYFMTTLPEGESYDLTPGTQAAHDYLWTMEGTAIELTHNHGTENDESFAVHPGNQQDDGFGHIAVNVDDVYATAEELEKEGMKFKKRPDEGRMKGLAFVYDPDGYWVELVKRGEKANIKNRYNFSQTMLRIKDPAKSLDFYRRLGLKVLNEKHMDDFSLYFMGSAATASDDKAVNEQFYPVLELTHNHGTEKKDDFKYNNGNEENRQGFGHIGFLVDDVYKACDEIEKLGYGFKKTPDGGNMKGLAFAYDPDGYAVEIIKRGGLDFGDKRKG
jgi:lactoylglutathione lyase